MSVWTFGLTDLTGVAIGEVHNAYERKLSLRLNGLPQASFRIRLDDPLADEIVSRSGDCLVKVYQDSTLRFIGEITTVEENGAGYRRVIDRQGLCNTGYVLPSSFEAGTTPASEIRFAQDLTSIADRGQFEEVLPNDTQDSQLRQAWADANVQVRKIPRELITFNPPSEEARATLAVNAAGPLWRLQKRLIGSPYPSAQRSWTDTAANLIIDTIINQTNTNNNSGIQLGTRDTLFKTDAGTDTSWAYKPASEGITSLQEAKVPFPIKSPDESSSLVALDNFNQSGTDPINLSGQTDAEGNTWSGAGDTRQITVRQDSHQATRAHISDTTSTAGRWAISGAADQTAVVVGVDWQASKAGATSHRLFAGPFARYSGTYPTEGWVWAYIDLDSNVLAVNKKIPGSGAGVHTNIGLYSFASGAGFGESIFYTIRLLIDEAGNFTVWHWETSSGLIGEPLITGQDADLVTGGSLATGKVGFSDNYVDSDGMTRNYDYFVSSTYTGPQSFDFEFAPIEPTTNVLSTMKIANLNVRTQIGTTTTAVFERGDGIRPDTLPTFGTDYIIGDYVTGRAKVAGEARFNGTFRIYEIDLTIDDEGKETLEPMLVPE